jgi:hypothetical protein
LGQLSEAGAAYCAGLEYEPESEALRKEIADVNDKIEANESKQN